MGAWADLTLASATMKGIAPVDLMNPDTGVYDSSRVSTDYLAAAKRYIQTRLTKDLPTFISEADGAEEFMDAAVTIAKSHINDLIQEMLAHAFLIRYYKQEATGRNNLFVERGIMAQEDFDMAIQAFIQIIRLDADFLTQAQSTTDSTTLSQHGVPVFIG